MDTGSKQVPISRHEEKEEAGQVNITERRKGAFEFCMPTNITEFHFSCASAGLSRQHNHRSIVKGLLRTAELVICVSSYLIGTFIVERTRFG